jgi:hypothetical protein
VSLLGKEQWAIKLPPVMAIRKSFIGKETLQFMLVLANVGVILSCPGRVVVKFIHFFFFVDRWKIGQLLSY